MATASSVYDIRSYGAVGDGKTDSLAAIRQAIAAAGKAGGGRVYIPVGTFVVSNIVDVNGYDGILISGDGAGSIIKSTNVNANIVRFKNCTRFGIEGVRIVATATARNATQEGICVEDSSKGFIRNNYLSGMASTAVMTRRSTGLAIAFNRYQSTLADGIHLTGGTSNVQIIGNEGYSTGDDTIAVVSYLTDGKPCSDIVIEANIVNTSSARGIANVGGKRVTIAGNNVESTASSGIHVVEDTTYRTYVPEDTIIRGNMVQDGGQYLSGKGRGNHFGIEITATAKGVLCEGNAVTNAFGHGLVCQASRATVANNKIKLSGQNGLHVIGAGSLLASGNLCENNGGYGGYFESVTDGAVTGNLFYNNNSKGTASVDNVQFARCANCVISGNESVDDRSRPLVERPYEIYSCTDLKFFSNGARVGDQRGPTFSGTCSNIEREVISGAGDPTAKVYKAGQLQLNTATGVLWLYTGSAWKQLATK